MKRMTAAGRLGPGPGDTPSDSGGFPLKTIKRTAAQVLELLNRSNAKGMVGLEYIVELVGGSFKKSEVLGYECALCNMPIASAGAVSHHVLQNLHKSMYVQKHFPASLAPLLPLMQWSSTRVTFESIQCRQAMRHICQRIEDRFGRLRPTIIRNDNYQRSKPQYLKLIDEMRHFDEDVPVPLTGFVGADELREQLKAKANGGGNFMPDANELEAYYEEEYNDDGRAQNQSLSDWIHKEKLREQDQQIDGTDDDDVILVTDTDNVHSKRYRHDNDDGIGHPTPAATLSPNGDCTPETYALYRRKLDATEAELQTELQRFETAPEEHPLYPSEWKQFWQRRSAELRAEGVDTGEYDFSADWTRFWLVRVHELNDDELKRADRRIRRELDLPVDGQIQPPPANGGASLSTAAKLRTSRWERSDSKPHSVKSGGPHEAVVVPSTAAGTASAKQRSDERDREHRKQRSDEKSSAAAASKSSTTTTDKKVSTSERKRDELHERGSAANASSSSASRSRSDRDRSPVERKSSAQSSSKQPASKSTHGSSGNSNSKSTSHKTTASSSSSSKPSTSDQRHNASLTEAQLLENLEPVTESVTVISVLRLLSAFEDLLGSSLGPRVVDLLSKAVALEKVKANLADELLMSSDNSVLLDTVSEKLKGLLLAGCVEQHKVRSVRKVIAHVMSITRIIDAQTKQREEQHMTEARLNLERLKEQERLADDQRRLREAEAKRREDIESRQLVMKQLATSITLQSKHITKEQLEALTDVYLKNRSADDTPYLFGLQMGSRFPDLKEDGGQDAAPSVAAGNGVGGYGAQQQQQHQQQQIDQQHPMLWNAHHQTQSTNPFRGNGGGVGSGDGYNNSGGVGGGHIQQQQQQPQLAQGQQQQQYGYYNNSGYPNAQASQMSQQQQHSNNSTHGQQQHSSGQHGYAQTGQYADRGVVMPVPAPSTYQQQLQLQQQQQQQQQQSQQHQHKSSSSSSASRSSRNGGGRSGYY